MNIKEAKNFIKDTVEVYLTKDAFGEYRIPVQNQRPIFMLGAPGIGKTAIMEQVAEELGIALVAYSMTHHTRQSALGLPIIAKKQYGGTEYNISEYSMSEIIAAVYETIEKSGLPEGILFLDEINCVSETLYPSMLQFLQYKTFGQHSVPDGWVVVTAGNPPYYNKSVREFDVVTLDRLKVLEIDPDYTAWKEYALNHGIHPAVISFLDANKDCFYHIETTADGKSYVTARGWEDVSTMLLLYEEKKIPAGESLICQYIRDSRVSSEFAAYYELYLAYKDIYHIQDIFEGKMEPSLLSKLQKAALDERLLLTEQLVDALQNKMRDIVGVYRDLAVLKAFVEKHGDDANVLTALDTLMKEKQDEMTKMKFAGTLSYEKKADMHRMLALLEQLKADLSGMEMTLTDAYRARIEALKANVGQTGTQIDAGFDFLEETFGKNSNEMVLAVTQLTYHTSSSAYFSLFGSKKYAEFATLLSVRDSKEELLDTIKKLELV